MSKKTYIPARLQNAAVDSEGNRLPVAGAEDIDAGEGKSQQRVNKDVDDTLTLHQQEINALDGQKYVTVTATDQTTAVTDVLPATGAVDTIYRVGSWDGTQYDDSVYSEYAWKGNGYQFLDKKEYGIDEKPTAGSSNFVESKGVYNDIMLLSSITGSILDYVTKNGLSLENVWTSAANAAYTLCEVYPGANIHIEAEAGYYTFLKSYSEPTVGDTPDFATGYSDRIYFRTLNVTAPADARYIYLYMPQGYASYIPTVFTIDGVDRLHPEGIQKSLKEKLFFIPGATQYVHAVSVKNSNSGSSKQLSPAETGVNKFSIAYMGGYMNFNNTTKKITLTTGLRIYNGTEPIYISNDTVVDFSSLALTFGFIVYNHTNSSLELVDHTTAYNNMFNYSVIGTFYAYNATILKVFADFEVRIDGKGSVNYLQQVVEDNQEDIELLKDKNLRLGSIISDDYPSIVARLAGDNTWDTSAGNKSVIIPVNPGDSVIISPQTNLHMYFGVFKTYPTTLTGTPDYSNAVGFTGRRDETETVSFTVPADSYYLLVNLMSLGEDRKPSQLFINSYNMLKGDEGLLRGLNGLSFWKGTQAQYDALPSYDNTTVYFIV